MSKVIARQRRLPGAGFSSHGYRRHAPGKRTGALLTGTALAGLVLTSVLGFGAAPAHATLDCGPPLAGLVTCTSAGNNYTEGISYISADDLTVEVDNDVVIDASEIGIELGGSGNKLLTLFPAGGVPGGVNIDTTGSENPGIAVLLEGGRTTIDAGDGTTIDTVGSRSPGIVAAVLGGDVRIDSSAAINTQGEFSPGIDAASIGFGGLFGSLDLPAETVVWAPPPHIGVNIDNNKDISTLSDGSAAIVGTAVSLPGISFDEPPYLFPGLPNHGVTIQNSAKLETFGEGSAGIDALSIDVRVPASTYMTGPGAPTGGVFVLNDRDGLIGTHSADSHGIWAATATVTLDANGLVPPGDIDHAIEGAPPAPELPGQSTRGVTEVVNLGTIFTEGYNAHGIFAGSLALNAELNIDLPHGDWVTLAPLEDPGPPPVPVLTGDGLGGVSVYNAGAIRTLGPSADGITGTSIIVDLDVNVGLDDYGMVGAAAPERRAAGDMPAIGGLAGGVFIRNEGSVETGSEILKFAAAGPGGESEPKETPSEPRGDYSPGISGVALNTNIDINVGGDLIGVGCDVFDLCDIDFAAGDLPGALASVGGGRGRGPKGPVSGGVYIENIGRPDILRTVDPETEEPRVRTGVTTYGEGSAAISTLR